MTLCCLSNKHTRHPVAALLSLTARTSENNGPASRATHASVLSSYCASATNTPATPWLLSLTAHTSENRRASLKGHPRLCFVFLLCLSNRHTRHPVAALLSLTARTSENRRASLKVHPRLCFVFLLCLSNIHTRHPMAALLSITARSVQCMIDSLCQYSV